MDLCDRNDIQALLARHGFRFSKALGQNFLITITESALLELLGSTMPYAPPDLPFYTSEGSVLDVPPLKAP